MRYLITGGAGFIGSNLAEAVVMRGHEVLVLDNFSTGHLHNLANIADKIEIVDGDITDYWTVAEAVAGCDYVLHQAALPSVQRSVTNPLTSNLVNVNGTLNVLECAKREKVKRVVFASSSSVYGESPTLPKVETMTPDPISPYAVSKLAGEQYCMNYHRLYGLPTVALRYFNIFGPNQDPGSDYAAVIPKFITAHLRDGSRSCSETGNSRGTSHTSRMPLKRISTLASTTRRSGSSSTWPAAIGSRSTSCCKWSAIISGRRTARSMSKNVPEISNTPSPRSRRRAPIWVTTATPISRADWR